MILICDECGESETVVRDDHGSLVAIARRKGWILGQWKKAWCSMECCDKRTRKNPNAKYGSQTRPPEELGV